MTDEQINQIARKFAELIEADYASSSANVPTVMARIGGAIREVTTDLTRELDEARSQRDGLVEALQIIADVPAVTPNGTLYYEVQSEDGQTGQMDVDPIGWVQHAGNKARAALDAAKGGA